MVSFVWWRLLYILEKQGKLIRSDLVTPEIRPIYNWKTSISSPHLPFLNTGKSRASGPAFSCRFRLFISFEESHRFPEMFPYAYVLGTEGFTLPAFDTG